MRITMFRERGQGTLDGKRDLVGAVRSSYVGTEADDFDKTVFIILHNTNSCERSIAKDATWNDLTAIFRMSHNHHSRRCRQNLRIQSSVDCSLMSIAICNRYFQSLRRMSAVYVHRSFIRHMKHTMMLIHDENGMEPFYNAQILHPQAI